MMRTCLLCHAEIPEDLLLCPKCERRILELATSMKMALDPRAEIESTVREIKERLRPSSR